MTKYRDLEQRIMTLEQRVSDERMDNACDLIDNAYKLGGELLKEGHKRIADLETENKRLNGLLDEIEIALTYYETDYVGSGSEPGGRLATKLYNILDRRKSSTPGKPENSNLTPDEITICERDRSQLNLLRKMNTEFQTQGIPEWLKPHPMDRGDLTPDERKELEELREFKADVMKVVQQSKELRCAGEAYDRKYDMTGSIWWLGVSMNRLLIDKSEPLVQPDPKNSYHELIEFERQLRRDRRQAELFREIKNLSLDHRNVAYAFDYQVRQVIAKDKEPTDE